MWAGDELPIHGAHLHQLATRSATPRRPPGRTPPIPHRRAGEQHTLRLVAQYGDACNLFDIPDGGRHGAPQAGRAGAPTASGPAGPYADIEKTISTRLEPARGTGRLRRSLSDCRARDRPCRGHHQRSPGHLEDRHAHTAAMRGLVRRGGPATRLEVDA
jgi:hypothetical protein